MKFKRRLLTGAYTLPRSVLDYTLPICTSSDCGFPDFISLGICTKASDVSSHLKIERLPDRDWNIIGLNDNTTWRVSLPGSRRIMVPNTRSFDILITSLFTPSHNSLSFTELELNTSLANNFFVFANAPAPPATNVVFKAVETLFYWCTKTYSLGVSSGAPSWAVSAPSAHVVDSDIFALDSMRRMDFISCSIKVGKPCNEVLFGHLSLAPPPGFESHAPIVVDEVAALTVSLMLQMSF
jgi:hypothetical protein